MCEVNSIKSGVIVTARRSASIKRHNKVIKSAPRGTPTLVGGGYSFRKEMCISWDFLLLTMTVTSLKCCASKYMILALFVLPVEGLFILFVYSSLKFKKAVPII